MRLYDGRAEFYQYDINQKLICDSCQVGEEIHFSNRFFAKAAVCLTYEFEDQVVVDVPNLYLISPYDLVVYRMYIDDNGKSTVDEYTFKVNRRKKPSTYVYVETEVLDYASLDGRITALEENSEDIFWAIYDQTTYQEIIDAINSGKLCVLKYGKLSDEDDFITAVHWSSRWVDFYGLRYSQELHLARVTVENKWTNMKREIFTKDFLKTAIDPDAPYFADNHVPTLKATYDAILKYGGTDEDEVRGIIEDHYYTKSETDKKLAEKAPSTMRVYNEYGTTDYTSEEIIKHLQNGGCTILDDVDLGGFPYLWSYAGTVFYGGIIPHIDKYIYICFAVSGNTATTVMFDMAEYVKLSDLEPVLKAFSDRFDDHYTKAEIDTMLGSYVNDIAELIGGEAIADS